MRPIIGGVHRRSDMGVPQGNLLTYLYKQYEWCSTSSTMFLGEIFNHWRITGVNPVCLIQCLLYNMQYSLHYCGSGACLTETNTEW